MPVLNAVAPVAALHLGAELLAVCADAQARVWDPASLKLIRTVPTGQKEGLWSISPDGKLLASATADHKIVVRELTRGAVVQTLAGHGERLRRLGVSPNGKTLVSNGEDLTVRAWDIASGRQKWATAGGDGNASVLIFSPDGSRVFSTNSDTDLRIWESAKGELLRKFEEFPLTLFAGKFSADGKRLVVGGADRKLTVWNTQGWKVERVIDTGTELVSGLALSGDGGRVLASGMNKDGFRLPVGLRLWDLATGRKLWEEKIQRSTSMVGLSADSKLAVWSCGDAKVEIRSV